ncbi:MAG: ABC transporter permease subunit [Oscillospiraceae bacterium]|nr:ABC transporter permease subunit [Oscillospiraceae bacterium]
MKKKIKKADIIIIIVLLLIAALVGVILHISGKNEAAADVSQRVTHTALLHYEDFQGRIMGIKTGSVFEKITMDYFPDKEYLYFDTDTDLIAALENDKIDGFLTDEPLAYMIHEEQDNVDYLRSPIIYDDYCFGFVKGTERSEILRSGFNEMLSEMKDSGELDSLKAKWLGNDEAVKTIDGHNLSGENGEISVAVLPDCVPFSYVKDNELMGYAVELSMIFAEKYGYSIQFEEVTVTSGLAGISGGKYDILASSLSVTEERKQSMDFSDVIYNGGVVLCMRGNDLLGGQDPSAEPDLTSYNGKKIGVQTDTVFDEMIKENIPGAEISYYNSYTDLLSALKSGIIDGFAADEPMVKYMMIEDSSVAYLHEYMDDYSFGFVFSKSDEGKKLCGEFSEYIKKIKSDGTLKKIDEVWFGTDESAKVIPDTKSLRADKGTLDLATEAANAPFVYMKNNQIVGYEIDIAYRFCKEYGYGLDITDMNFDGIIPAVSGGKDDFGAAAITITDERRESVNFSEPHYDGGCVLAVTAETLANGLAAENGSTGKKGSFIDSVKASFERNFIREDRYKLIFEGIRTTCIITVLSVIFGSLLAFLICLFRRMDSVLSEKIANLYVKLLQGTPIVVLLMILYYVVFGKSKINAIWVAVIGFSLNFGAYVSEILRSGIESVDVGQHEGALALGFNENQAFFKFIFPQAAVRQLPVYRGEIISMLKNTSIVGYIAIQDLTKMSDIIRSRTYEAFFPLIVTAVIYFILAWVIALILKLILKQIDPKAKRAVRRTAK